MDCLLHVQLFDSVWNILANTEQLLLPAHSHKVGRAGVLSLFGKWTRRFK